MSYRELSRDAAIIAAVTAGILISLELALRVLFPGWSNSLRRYEKPLMADERTLVTLRANVLARHQRTPENGGYIVDWRTNSDGFRGPELAEAPARRVLVYGDSNVQAIFSGFERTFPARLSTLLADRGVPGVEVVNAGMIGSGPDQNLLRLQEDLPRYEPDVVIFHVFADNDFGDLLRNRLFELGRDGSLRRTPIAGNPGADYLEASQPSLWRRLLESTFINRAVVLMTESPEPQPLPGEGYTPMRLVQSLMERTRQEFENYRDGGPTRISLWRDHYDIDIAVDPDQQSARTKIRLMEAVLVEARRATEAQGADFIVVIQPSIVDLTKDNYYIGYADLAPFAGYRRTNLVDAVSSICRENDIAFVDLYPIFADNRPEDLYFASANNHWNDAGQALAAETLAAYLLDRGAFGSAHRSVDTASSEGSPGRS